MGMVLDTFVEAAEACFPNFPARMMLPLPARVGAEDSYA